MVVVDIRLALRPVVAEQHGLSIMLRMVGPVGVDLFVLQDGGAPQNQVFQCGPVGCELSPLDPTLDAFSAVLIVKAMVFREMVFLGNIKT